MANRIDKNELKGPDAFVSASDRALAWMERHARAIAAVIGAAVVVAVAYVGFEYYQSVREASAAEALYPAESELRKAEEKIRDERAQDLQELAKGKAAKKSEEPRPADFSKDFAPTVDKLVGQLKEHSGTKAAMVSALNLAYFLIQQKQYEKALEVIEIPTYRPAKGDVMGGLWNLHRGLVYLENKKFQEAIQAYEAVLAAADIKYMHPEALLKLGVTYELQGDVAKARETYEKIGREFPQSEASTSAQQYIRLLALKNQQAKN